MKPKIRYIDISVLPRCAPDADPFVCVYMSRYDSSEWIKNTYHLVTRASLLRAQRAQLALMELVR